MMDLSSIIFDTRVDLGIFVLLHLKGDVNTARRGDFLFRDVGKRVCKKLWKIAFLLDVSNFENFSYAVFS